MSERATAAEELAAWHLRNIERELAEERERRIRAEAASEVLRGKFDSWDEDGAPTLPRGWTPIDGGRLDELEAAEAEVERLREALEGLVNTCREYRPDFYDRPTAQEAWNAAFITARSALAQPSGGDA